MASFGRQYVVVGSHNRSLNPSLVTDDSWVWVDNPAAAVLGETYGKWLVFAKRGSELDGLWHMIHPLVSSGSLGATQGKCSTSFPNPNAFDPNRGVICVYTTRDMRDQVGERLLKTVQRTIRYKSDEATMAGRYAVRGHKGTTEKTLHWK